jgi:glycosyltransferase involved in cell wall biosynthesis
MKLFDDKKKVKTVRVLVYPNITFQEDLEKDSYIQVIKNQISLLNEIRSDLWFYLILPCPVPSLAFDNVTQWYIDFETYPQTMRSNFQVDVVRKMLHSGHDFDLVMSHLPEHTHQLVNTMYNTTHHVPPVFGYCHWWDLKGVVAWPKDSFLQNITGLLEYDRCYLNTQHQKDLVLNQASETFVPKVINKLDKILTVQHLGVNNSDIVSEINRTPEKIIVFNHRPDTYKHFKEFIAVCDKLWEMRKDFKVWIPLLDKPNRDYVITDKGDKQWYYKGLQNCYMGFSPKQKYGGWSVAMTDGMMNGLPYIMYDGTYYHELNDNGDFFKDDHEALMLMNTYLDDHKYRNEQAEQAIDCIRENLIYKNKIVEMNDYMNDLLYGQKAMRAPNILSDRKTDRLSDVIELIRKGATTKKHIMDHLGWGRGIKWTPYRRALMNHPNIYDVMDEYPTYVWVDRINQ